MNDIHAPEQDLCTTTLIVEFCGFVYDTCSYFDGVKLQHLILFASLLIFAKVLEEKNNHIAHTRKCPAVVKGGLFVGCKRPPFLGTLIGCINNRNDFFCHLQCFVYFFQHVELVTMQL